MLFACRLRAANHSGPRRLYLHLHRTSSSAGGSFRATGITVYLLNGGLLEYAQQMAAHESARTTKLYDRRNDQVTLDQVERIVL
ncbi:MAG TPA: hypothetical protein VNW92_26660 [Polyangiaceae bacterium]|nr:hypothetical protein [Polyangiaceae bacterium]